MSVSIPGVNASVSAKTVEKIEDVYKTFLEVQSELNAIYQETSLTLKKAFESIELLAPQLNKKHLHLPTLPTSQEKKALRQEPKSERPKATSKKPKKSSSQLPKPATSSSNWMLKHQGPGAGLTELLQIQESMSLKLN